jgi:glutamate/tyrosine decarboxylase-like PLP-dependent enzyme
MNSDQGMIRLILKNLKEFVRLGKLEYNKDDLDILTDVFSDLSSKSVPWYDSSNYFGHMCHAILPISYFSQCVSVLYNPNNVSTETSPVTSVHEQEVLNSFVALMGYDKSSTGCFMSCGTNANLQGLYTARNAKTFLLDAVAKKEAVIKNLVDGRDKLKNIPLNTLAGLMAKNTNSECSRMFSEFDCNDDHHESSVLIVSKACHYSVKSAAQILGIAKKNIIEIDCHDDLTMDTSMLETVVNDLVIKDIPILAVVCVAGTTENGSFDDVADIFRIRDELLSKYDSSFWVHLDAAFGGYSRSLIIDKINSVIPKDIFDASHKGLLSDKLYNSLCSMSKADSITIDPHKMGYINYGCAIHLLKESMWSNLISKSAAYVFEDGTGEISHGVNNIEGSRPGSMATAVYVANKKHPLNSEGYGKIMIDIMRANRSLCEKMTSSLDIIVNERSFAITPVTNSPDFNTTLFYASSLSMGIEEQNKINKYIYNNSRVSKGQMPSFYLSSTSIVLDGVKTYVLRGIVMDRNLVGEDKNKALWENMRNHISALITRYIKLG